LPADAEKLDKLAAEPAKQDVETEDLPTCAAAKNEVPAPTADEPAVPYYDPPPPVDEELEYEIFCRQSVRPFIPSEEPLPCASDQPASKRPERQIDRSMKRRMKKQRRRERELAERHGSD
jgi:hypothetical protein